MEFDFITDLNVQSAKLVTQLIEENVELINEIQCLELELKEYRLKEMYNG